MLWCPLRRSRLLIIYPTALVNVFQWFEWPYSPSRPLTPPAAMAPVRTEPAAPRSIFTKMRRVSRLSTSGTSSSTAESSQSTRRRTGCSGSGIPTRSRLIKGADIMWSGRLMVGLILMASSTAAYATTRCPATNGGRSLSDVEVFDGPPAELASLEPGDGGWKLDYKAAAPDGHFYLECRYAADGTPLAIKLPPSISSCRIMKYPRVSCR